MQAYAMRITIMERQRKKFEYENEVTTQIARMRYFRKAAAGAKYVGSPPCLQAITCISRGCRFHRVHIKSGDPYIILDIPYYIIPY